MHSRTRAEVAMLGGRDVDAVFIKPLEEGQQVRAGLVTFLHNTLLVVGDAQRRLCVGSTGELSDSSMASRLTRKMIFATRRRTDEDEQEPRRDVAHGGAHVCFLCFGAENRRAPGNAGDRRVETSRASGHGRCECSGY